MTVPSRETDTYLSGFWKWIQQLKTTPDMLWYSNSDDYIATDGKDYLMTSFLMLIRSKSSDDQCRLPQSECKFVLHDVCMIYGNEFTLVANFLM